MSNEQSIFNIGDVVQLRSGSVPMTVLHPLTGSSVHVGWMADGGSRLCTDALPAEALVLVNQRRARMLQDKYA